MGNHEESVIVWTDYMKYRAKFRGYELAKVEDILRHSGEKYFDTATQRLVVVGKHNDKLVPIPYEKHGVYIWIKQKWHILRMKIFCV